MFLNIKNETILLTPYNIQMKNNHTFFPLAPPIQDPFQFLLFYIEIFNLVHNR